MFRLAYFEYRYLVFERDRHKLWIFDDPTLEEPMDERVWQLRLSIGVPERILAWLGLQVAELDLPNLFSFNQRLQTDEGAVALKSWKASFNRCVCSPPTCEEDCQIHRIEAHAEWIVQTEAAHRLRLLGWYEVNAPERVVAQRISTLRTLRPD